MSERNSALIEVTREAPCDGRREELLSLAALRDEAPSAPAARRHLRTCRRCRAFLDSVHGELRLARDAFGELGSHVGRGSGSRQRLVTGTDPDDRPADAALANLPTSRAFDRWLDRQLAERTQFELAEAMTRTARWLHRLDPDVAQLTAAPSEEGESGMVVPSSPTEFAANLEIRLAQASGARTGQRVQSHGAGRISEIDSAFVESLRRMAECGWPSRDSCLRLAGRLLDRASDLTKGRSGSAWLMKSQLALYGDDETAALDLLDRASLCLNTPTVTAIIILNQSVIAFERDLDAAQFRRLSRALECGANSATVRLIHQNLLVWKAATGQFDALARELEAIERVGETERARRRLTPSKIIRFIEFLASRHGLPRTRTVTAIRRCIEALHAA